MKIYLVESTFGSWDSYHKDIMGIFDNRIDAENLIKEINERISIIQENSPKYPSDELLETDEDLYDEMIDNYYKCKNNHPFSGLNDYNDSCIKEFELNSILCKLEE